MKQSICACALGLLIWPAAIVLADSQGDEAGSAGADEAAIRQAVTAYVNAFNERDAKKLAQFWSPEGVYISRVTGDAISGREALEKDFAALFENETAVRLEVTTDTIEFISPNVALERGLANVIRGEGPPETTAYSVVYVKRDGQWLIDRTSEEEPPVEPPSHYEQLKELEWLVGSWIDEEGGSAIRTDCRWTRNRNFLVRSFTATVENEIELTGMQVIGWDAAEEQIRSWVFDSDGGVTEGSWQRRDDGWEIRASATLSDGRRAASTSILRPIDENSFGWQQINRVVDGEILPNIAEVIIVRE
ncbi:MAG: SgcJ/EcaC family oxidoreductase [Planctomycetota bacterium]|nr:MAG: SgcJ/EcaC family oxidoreductase [Planctomycetota bacterium]REJ91573.1 MAG: SgcJ/EcaC family oxidoreductase [Planctomycetota bacterium]REK23945.1 MAG: SgcJ/EcaC family oxidoreductase [Planctomycetota bacterium]REK38363.1 MAG: SgcJ/EcaC family oxidoreductase [Planctomycetota bacterium]